jgi:hypothetical protein
MMKLWGHFRWSDTGEIPAIVVMGLAISLASAGILTSLF